jgi:hypothetical protein
LDELLGVVVDLEPDSFSRGTIAKNKGIGYKHAALVHVKLFSLIFSGLENSSWRNHPGICGVVTLESSEEETLIVHLFVRKIASLVGLVSVYR